MSILSNINGSETSNQILSEASLGWGKGCIRFWPDRIRTFVSMATDSSHRVIMGGNLFSAVFDRVLFIVAGNKDMNESS